MEIKVDAQGTKHYPVICCNCKHNFHVAKSILQEMGMLEAGMATCTVCGKSLNLTFLPDEEQMKPMLLADFMQQKKTNQDGNPS
jgi:hypothetical protein